MPPHCIEQPHFVRLWIKYFPPFLPIAQRGRLNEKAKPTPTCLPLACRYAHLKRYLCALGCALFGRCYRQAWLDGSRCPHVIARVVAYTPLPSQLPLIFWSYTLKRFLPADSPRSVNVSTFLWQALGFEPVFGPLPEEALSYPPDLHLAWLVVKPQLPGKQQHLSQPPILPQPIAQRNRLFQKL